MNKSIEIIVCGHICLDITPKFDIKRKEVDIFIPGKLINIGELVLSTGGVVSNTGLSLFKLGAKVEFITKVGDDFIGREIINVLRKTTNLKKFRGIKIAKEEASAYSIILSPPGIDRIIFHNPSTNDTFSYDDIDFDIIKKAKIFHFGYPPIMRKIYLNEGEELLKIFKKVKKLGVTTSLDMTLPDSESESGKVNWKNILIKIIPYTDIFLPSFEEILFMMNPEKFIYFRKKARLKSIIDFLGLKILKEISDELLNMGGKIIGIKCGKYGFYLRSAEKEKLKEISAIKKERLDNFSEREILMESFKVRNILSALGAGDAAVAGFLMGILKGETVENTLKAANCVGAQNLTSYDAISGIKSWEETKKMIEKKS